MADSGAKKDLEIVEYRNQKTGLSMAEMQFCDLIKAGSSIMDAYICAMRPGTDNRSSIGTLSSRLHKQARIQARLQEIADDKGVDARLSDKEHLRMRCVAVLLDLAESPRADGRLKLEAVKALASTSLVGLLAAPGPHGSTTVNVQANGTAPRGAKEALMHELAGLLPSVDPLHIVGAVDIMPE